MTALYTLEVTNSRKGDYSIEERQLLLWPFFPAIPLAGYLANNCFPKKHTHIPGVRDDFRWFMEEHMFMVAFKAFENDMKLLVLYKII